MSRLSHRSAPDSGHIDSTERMRTRIAVPGAAATVSFNLQPSDPRPTTKGTLQGAVMKAHPQRHSAATSLRYSRQELSSILLASSVLEDRSIPSFFIFEISVVRFNPKCAAAPPGPPITHPARSSA